MTRSRTKKTQHHHGCILCNRRYSCGIEGCQTARRCNACISGRMHDGVRAWEPQECCFRNSPLPIIRTKKERDPYDLVGEPWFKCPTCARQFPCQPEQVKT